MIYHKSHKKFPTNPKKRYTTKNRYAEDNRPANNRPANNRPVDKLLFDIYKQIDEYSNKKQQQSIEKEELEEVPISHLLSSIPPQIQTWCKTRSNWESITHYKIHITIPDEAFSSNREGHIQLFLLLPKEQKQNKKQKPNVDKMLHYITMWYRLALMQSPPTCSNPFRVFLYLTPFQKELPHQEKGPQQKEIKKQELGQINVNTALTTSGCGNNTERNDIVVFRWEEWFKVMIHESFHKLGLDDCTEEEHDHELSKHIEKNSKVISEESLGVYEAYTEAWAEIINVLFYTKDQHKPPVTNPRRCLQLIKKTLQKEQQFSMEQRRKIEDYNKKGDTLHYRQDIKIHSYYSLKQILLQNYPIFLKSCLDNNGDAFPMRKNKQASQKYIQLWSRLLSQDVPPPQNSTTNNSLRMTRTELDWFY